MAPLLRASHEAVMPYLGKIGSSTVGAPTSFCYYPSGGECIVSKLAG
jgi:hypothetical protein